MVGCCVEEVMPNPSTLDFMAETDLVMVEVHPSGDVSNVADGFATAPCVYLERGELAALPWLMYLMIYLGCHGDLQAMGFDVMSTFVWIQALANPDVVT